MNTEEVGKKLVDYCRKGEWMKALNDLYAKDIVSVEAREMENMPAEMRGIGHLQNLEAPDDFDGILLNFLALPRELLH